MLEPGLRVVRGFNWPWVNQGGGFDSVGTVSEVGAPGSKDLPENTVVVKWDCGQRSVFQGSYDLIILDNAPSGVEHLLVSCDACDDGYISGIRYKCTVCCNYDLCSPCYHSNKHDLDHIFTRYDTPESRGVKLTPRNEEERIGYKGIFKGAIVRIADWERVSANTGEVGEGTVTEMAWRMVAKVTWYNGDKNDYWVGRKGVMNLKYVKPAPGGDYYIHHLPIFYGALNAISSVAHHAAGDRVKVHLGFNALKNLQQVHGCWNPRMAEFIGKVGIIRDIMVEGDVAVEYEEYAAPLIFHPGALERVEWNYETSPRAPPSAKKKTIREETWSMREDESSYESLRARHFEMVMKEVRDREGRTETHRVVNMSSSSFNIVNSNHHSGAGSWSGNGPVAPGSRNPHKTAEAGGPSARPGNFRSPGFPPPDNIFASPAFDKYAYKKMMKEQMYMAQAHSDSVIKSSNQLSQDVLAYVNQRLRSVNLLQEDRVPGSWSGNDPVAPGPSNPYKTAETGGPSARPGHFRSTGFPPPDPESWSGNGPVAPEPSKPYKTAETGEPSAWPGHFRSPEFPPPGSGPSKFYKTAETGAPSAPPPEHFLSPGMQSPENNYAPSTFGDPEINPTVKERIDLARAISRSLAESSKFNKGLSMHVNQNKKPVEKMHEDKGPELSTGKAKPSLPARPTRSHNPGTEPGIPTPAPRLKVDKGQQPNIDQVRYLENKIQEMEETQFCSICIERRRSIAFLCGHQACGECADQLDICHMCRKPITTRINLY